MPRKKLGNCYKIAANLVLDWRISGEADAAAKENREIFLVHAEVFHPKTGWHGHAWAERDDDLTATVDLYDGLLCAYPSRIRNAYDFSGKVHVIVPAALYHYMGSVRSVHYYTPDQTAELLLRHETYGPWHV